VDLVIVNWNSANYLNQCINSIFSTVNGDYVKTVFIIDNNSSDDSLLRVDLNDKIKIIRNKKNIGFAAAANQGFHLSTAPYILLLNPDTQLFPSTLKDCLNYMSSHSETDILGCRLLNEEGQTAPSCARFPTPVRLFIDSIGVSKVFPQLFKTAILMTDWDHTTSRFVDQLMGAFMFIRKSVFEKIGYFDEQFFVYCEELDFSKRLSEQGGKSFFNADITAMHVGQGTTKAVKSYRLYLNLESRLKYARKHFSKRGFLLVWTGTFLVEPISRIFFLLLKRKFGEIKDVVQGYRMLISGKRTN
jgi:GT2 family glycosyltransferase